MTGTILIADSVATRRIALRARLAPAFRRVVLATGAAEALAAARDDMPEVVLAASDLPDMALADLRRRLAAAHRAAGATAPALAILTPAEDRAARLTALAAGADDAMPAATPVALMLARLRRLDRKSVV